ncbi:MAG: helix-turn-helix transcriptional regulator [Flavobacteriaceae bacterium]
MLNIDAFIKRLEELMEQQQLNAAAFAEKIGVQRSSVSHVLSKRNRPSLDFILKIEEQFEDVSFDWLLLGKSKPSLHSPSLSVSEINLGADLEPSQIPAKIPSSSPTVPLETPITSVETMQIIQTYKDGTFRVFLPKS